MSDDVERLGEALFLLSDRLRAAGLIVAGNPVADAYDTVVKEWSALTASRSYSDEIEEGVTQADRDAAAHFVALLPYEEHPLVQAFRAHRVAALNGSGNHG